MTLEELMKCVENVKIETEYQPIEDDPKKPIEPVYWPSTTRTFLGEYVEGKKQTDVIGREDYRGLRALCFNEGAPRTRNTSKKIREEKDRGGEDR